MTQSPALAVHHSRKDESASENELAEPTGGPRSGRFSAVLLQIGQVGVTSVHCLRHMMWNRCLQAVRWYWPCSSSQQMAQVSEGLSGSLAMSSRRSQSMLSPSSAHIKEEGALEIKFCVIKRRQCL